MPPSPPVQHKPHPWQHTVLLAGDSKNTVLAEMAGTVNHMAYSPYGQQSSRQEVITHLGFNGELREAKTDWYFLGNGYRVYSPRLMRFHSPDRFSPFGKGWLNAYMYCGGEPVMRADPTGESWFSKWLFERFADVMQVFSPVGTGGASVGKTVIKSTSVSGGDFLADVLINSKRPFSTPSRLQPLGKSHKRRSAFQIQQNSNSTTTNNVSVTSSSASNGVNYTAQKIHMTDKVNLVTTVKTRGGQSLTGRDSGGYAMASGSSSSPTKAAPSSTTPKPSLFRLSERSFSVRNQ